MEEKEIFIRRCFELAQKGLGLTEGNPIVGCVLVHNGKIIGEGYHKMYGGPHAEVLAVESVENKALLKEASLYVSLEPCSFFGKTPPCTEWIIQHQIPRVYISCLDPNPEVNGKGVKRLQESGILVEHGILENEGRSLNKRFFTFIEKQRPYIILKWAQSQDAFMDICREKQVRGSYRISSEKLRFVDHLWRSQEQAVLVGTKTLLCDNPISDARFVRNFKPPIRIGLDRRGILPDNLNLLDDKRKTIIFCGKENTALSSKVWMNTEFIPLKEWNLTNILHCLKERKIISLYVEGGKDLLESFISENLWDEARVFIGNVFLKEGLQAPMLPKNIKTQNKISSCFLPSNNYPLFFDEQTIVYYKNDKNFISDNFDANRRYLQGKRE